MRRIPQSPQNREERQGVIAQRQRRKFVLKIELHASADDERCKYSQQKEKYVNPCAATPRRSGYEHFHRLVELGVL
jgi:hypothetical protein